MRVDCLALCLQLLANRVTGRQRYIAALQTNTEPGTCGRVGIYKRFRCSVAGVAVGDKRRHRERSPTALQRDRFTHSLVFSACATNPLQPPSTPTAAQGSGPTLQMKATLLHPDSRRTAAARKDCPLVFFRLLFCWVWSWICPNRDKSFTFEKPLLVVEGKKTNSNFSNASERFNYNAVEAKMFSPVIFSWIKKSR